MQSKTNLVSALAWLSLASCGSGGDDTAPTALALYADTGGTAAEPASLLDWIEIRSTTPNQPDVFQLRLARRSSAAEPVTIQIVGSTQKLSADGYQIYIDADADPGTGIQPGQWPAVGADFLIENDRLYPADEASGWFGQELEATVTHRDLPEDGGKELVITASALSRFGAGTDIGLGLVDRSTNEKVPQDRFWRSQPTWKGGGMIIPAYFSPFDPAWDEIVRQAEAVQQTTGGRRDFWVVMNGASGPFTATNDIDKVNERAKQLHDANAKVFGYVHACNTIMLPNHTFQCDGLRRVDDVTAAIDAWLKADVDGIWLDEFYPQFEKDWQADHPQYVPTGRELDQITTHIRDVPRKLTIIGNAGGYLVSNAYKYAALVDVLCSFEGSSLEPDLSVTPATPGIVRQAVKPRYGQLALFHSIRDASSVANIVQRAFDEGYSHVFVGDGRLDDSTAWTRIPPYFASEVHDVWPDAANLPPATHTDTPMLK